MKHDDSITAYPLTWPDGWPRTPEHKRDSGSRFGQVTMQTTNYGSYRQKGRITPDKARRALRDELGRLGAKNPIISSNVPLRQDGEMYAGAADRRHDDPGIAVYFFLKGKQMVMAQDAYDNVAANMRSLAHAIDGLRTVARHGGGVMLERAFTGFTALPAPEGSQPKRPWWIVLGYSEHAEDRADLSVEEVLARFKVLAKRRHPDVDGGSMELFVELQQARDEAVQALGG